MSDLEDYQMPPGYGETVGRVVPVDAAARIAELEARLEIDPSHPYDGINARDETIRQLEAEVARLAREALSIDGQAQELMAENARLREAVTTADLQIGDGHIDAARATLHAAMDAT